jgi:HTH-type transcriptional regulator/antitoxin HigA
MKFIGPIKNEEQYNRYLARIEVIFDAKPGSQAGEELELLLILVKLYEDEHYPIPFPDPIEAIKVRMEDLSLKAVDLIPYIGNKGNVSKILNRKRPLTLEMIRKLSEGLDIPVEVLVKPIKLKVA